MSLISAVFQSDPANVSDDNPHGYWPAFLADPKSAMRDAIKNTLALGCIGTLFWDWGGPVNQYVGTPWLSTHPQAFDDEVFAAFAAAGLRTGGTIRPRARIKNRIVETTDPFAVLADRVDYANSRWGCTLFYVDDNWKTETNNSPGNLIDPVVFRRLGDEFPDCLFFPEGADARYEDLPRVRPLRFFPNPAQNRTPPLIKVEATFVPSAKQLADLATAFRAGAWGLVSATWTDAPEHPNPANRLMTWASGLGKPAGAGPAVERSK